MSLTIRVIPFVGADHSFQTRPLAFETLLDADFLTFGDLFKVRVDLGPFLFFQFEFH